LASPWSALLLIGLLPIASAAPSHNPISDITFRDFSKFVEQNFSSTISLATVLVVLFTATSNPDLLNLHARQQNPLSGETAQVISGWMKALARALEERLGKDVDSLFKTPEQKPKLDVNQVQNAIGTKLVFSQSCWGFILMILMAKFSRCLNQCLIKILNLSM
jgi:hypothetical protein